MKLSYKEKVKEPFILELSTDEMALIRYHLGEQVDNMKSKSINFKCQSEARKDKSIKKIWKSQERSTRDLIKVQTRLEDVIKQWLWPSQ